MKISQHWNTIFYFVFERKSQINSRAYKNNLHMNQLVVKFWTHASLYLAIKIFPRKAARRKCRLFCGSLCTRPSLHGAGQFFSQLVYFPLLSIVRANILRVWILQPLLSLVVLCYPLLYFVILPLLSGLFSFKKYSFSTCHLLTLEIQRRTPQCFTKQKYYHIYALPCLCLPFGMILSSA